ncbi:MAG: hypothetical protein JW731_06270 [Bacteroidales bacterium]|nr:hypothetical protein [Bacteroidales bacterium]
MADFQNEELKIRMTDVYCVIKNKNDGFYWVINLENHPASFILDRSFQNFLSADRNSDQESMVIIQPTI